MLYEHYGWIDPYGTYHPLGSDDTKTHIDWALKHKDLLVQTGCEAPEFKGKDVFDNMEVIVNTFYDMLAHGWVRKTGRATFQCDRSRREWVIDWVLTNDPETHKITLDYSNHLRPRNPEEVDVDESTRRVVAALVKELRRVESQVDADRQGSCCRVQEVSGSPDGRDQEGDGGDGATGR